MATAEANPGAAWGGAANTGSGLDDALMIEAMRGDTEVWRCRFTASKPVLKPPILALETKI